MTRGFSPSHRGGSGSPLLCLHGFMDTWRTWELVLPALEARHDVLAVTLPCHAGGPPLADGITLEAFLRPIEAELDAAGFERAHVVGNSLGGYLGLHLAARGRARSVVGLAPAGGWAEDDTSFADTLVDAYLALQELVRDAAPYADEIVATREGRRRVTSFTTTAFDHIPPELLAHQILGAARCDDVAPLLEAALREGWHLDAAAIDCPVRIVWGSDDLVLPWPDAAVRFRREWLPHADWIVMEGTGHCPQLDSPLEAAALVTDFTNR